MPHAASRSRSSRRPPTDDGADQVTYLLAANPGERARPLARAASGGELSRAMLAARVVLSEAPPTLVFDEVDAGIGGEAGAAVGRSLQALGGAAPGALRHPPRAGRGVRRRRRSWWRRPWNGAGRGAPWTGHADVVDGDERVAELSRMLAGVGRLVARPQPRRRAARRPRGTLAAERQALRWRR